MQGRKKGRPLRRAAAWATLFILALASPSLLLEESDSWDTGALSEGARQQLEQARNYRNHGAYDHALPIYEGLLLEYSQNPHLWYEVGNVYAAKKDFAKAKEALDRAAFLRPQDATFRLGWPTALQHYGKQKEAIEELKRIVQEHPEFEQAHKQLAQYLLYEQKLDAALKEYDVLLERSGAQQGILLDKIQALKAASRWDAAVAEYEKFLRKDPANRNVRLEMIQVLTYAQRWQDAVKQYDVLLEAHPKDMDLRRAKIQMFEYAQDFPSAIAECNVLLGQDPKDVPTLLQQAKLESWTNRWDEAIENCQRVLDLDPGNIEALTLIAKLYGYKGQWKQSQGAYEKILRLKPRDPQTMEELANVFFYGQKYEAARELYNQVLQVSPQSNVRLSSRLDEIRVVFTPTLSYSFLYYQETNRSVSPRTTVKSIYNSTEFVYPYSEALKLFFLQTFRHDDTIQATALSYTPSFQLRLRDNQWYRASLAWEVSNHGINPRWGFRNTLSTRFWERTNVDMSYQYQTFWDTNKAHSAGLTLSQTFFEKRDVQISYRFNYDVIDDSSAYFVAIKFRENDILDLVTNTVNLEKYWTIGKAWTITTGTTYSATSQGRSTLGLYGNLSFPLAKQSQMFLGTAFTDDTKEISSLSTYAYVSYRF